MKAATQDASVLTLIKRFLTKLASGASDIERLKREERELQARIIDFSASDRVLREDAHERGA